MLDCFKTEFYSIRDVMDRNDRAGFHFFERGNLRYFRCRVSEDLYRVPGYGAYFVTSEQFHDHTGRTEPRAYTVRYAHRDGKVDTVGEFQAYETGRQAKREALRLSLLDHS